MLWWRTLRMECTQWVVTVAPPPLGFFYKLVWPLKHNCFRYMYHVNDGCVEGFPNIPFSVEMHQILQVISILIHRHWFNARQYLMTIINVTFFKLKEKRKSFGSYHDVLSVLISPICCLKQESRLGRKSSGSV